MNKEKTFIAVVFFIFLFFQSHSQNLVASRKPDGLVLSTGNIYFTSHDAAGAAVWRTSKTGVAGQEGVLYWEAGAKFGDIVYAQSGNNYFGYFFAEKGGEITIRRVSLAGGNATVIATITNVDISNSHHNLVTDGSNLYWQDVSSIRKISINGGNIVTLDQTRNNTPTAGIDIRNDRIIYADLEKIKYVSTSGGITNPDLRIIATASSQVTALHAGATYTYWGERNGSVKRKLSGSAIQTLQAAGNQTPISISSDGDKYAWSQCSGGTCTVKLSNGHTSQAGTNAALIGVSGRTVFFGSATGLHRIYINNLPF